MQLRLQEDFVEKKVIEINIATDSRECSQQERKPPVIPKLRTFSTFLAIFYVSFFFFEYLRTFLRCLVCNRLALPFYLAIGGSVGYRSD